MVLYCEDSGDRYATVATAEEIAKNNQEQDGVMYGSLGNQSEAQPEETGGEYE